jgi:hypothetical protein
MDHSKMTNLRSKAWPDVWETFAFYHTTGEFDEVDGLKFYRHCGPTAMTNLILTLKKQEDVLRRGTAAFKNPALPDPAAVFRKCARTGSSRLFYLNADLFGRFGGTSDLMVVPYILSCLRKFGLRKVRIRGIHPVTKKNVIRAVERGSILYLALHFHPRYRNHHLLAYSAEEIVTEDGRGVEFYLKCADGWAHVPQYLSLTGMKYAFFIEIGM